jgi:hypothetical protein
MTLPDNKLWWLNHDATHSPKTILPLWQDTTNSTRVVGPPSDCTMRLGVHYSIKNIK